MKMTALRPTLQAGLLSTFMAAVTLTVWGSVPAAGFAVPPPNVSAAMRAADAYHDSGAYQKDFDAVIAQASQYLAQQAPKVSHPAIVLDVDETVLSNWPQIHANHYGDFDHGDCSRLPAGPCGEHAWVRLAQAPVFPATRQLIRQAEAEHVAVFLLTGRHERHRADVVRNLHQQGVTGWTAFYMRPDGEHRPAASFKPEVRARIEAQGYHILETIGDQPSDLSGGHAQRGFLLPNPFYSVE
ncbi:HAD family acid phosphatase [Oecophyllibacter saccharovorans]|nr:HAD family acid phosphatase [Oecophyllibacter saccharovorans]